MKKHIVVALLFLLVFSPVLNAKVPVAKITITASGKAPIEITDPKTVSYFSVWSGPGTFWNEKPSTEKQSFIMDWAHRCAEPPASLQRYRVRFYATNDQLIYTVDYVVDPSVRRGYVYLPGRSDDAYRANTSTILRGVEGDWFLAWAAWDKVAMPALVKSAQSR
jgi:hypothetical protein